MRVGGEEKESTRKPEKWGYRGNALQTEPISEGQVWGKRRHIKTERAKRKACPFKCNKKRKKKRQE